MNQLTSGQIAELFNISKSKLRFYIDGKLQVQVSHPDKPVSACCN